MSFLRNVAINVESHFQQRRWIREAARRVELESHDLAGTLGRALRAVHDHDFTAEERACIRNVEALRRSLLATLRPLEVVELGAGRGGKGGRFLPMTIARSALSSKSAFWAGLLFKLIREARPQRCLELGTNLGISAAYMASAARLNGDGTLVTLEGVSARAALARRNLDLLGLDNASVVPGRFQDTLQGVLDRGGPVDFAFVDGHHDELATREYFSLIAARTSRSALIVLDDISWSVGMTRAWEVVSAHPRVAFSIDLKVLGICVLGSPVSG